MFRPPYLALSLLKISFQPASGIASSSFCENVAVCEGRVIQTGGHEQLLIAGPPLECDDAVGIRLMDDVDVLGADRAKPADERNEILVKPEHRAPVSVHARR